MPITFQFLDEMEKKYAPRQGPNESFGWDAPDQSILDDRRGSLRSSRFIVYRRLPANGLSERPMAQV
jgi:hypothetical protein